ncbi:hypothetical protein DACRYDRAFT_94404 [Dacryopinax primogenitus]|uniref:RING-type domain-containing protein n=1 Tax=Dacryopinax primogenitus (strain DJM 731) TaxID=1858805 RepID=M5GDR4_DACPD|nr:uncharacterized protein DACRYDRAFT_94404 [Dacryopinax primogenitus]EJU02633.1 hypothetical protein DACRYDRAFT_94404 [Dacryopinax primogenitus]
MSLKPLHMANLPPAAIGSTTGPGHGSGQASKASLNHLLNFSLPPREPVVQHRPRRARRVDQSTAVWNKERFVNAQHHFVLRPNGDYSVHFADPDIFFQWPDILQVIVPPPSTVQHKPSELRCPICLSPPVAPRITKCGHVYCYPCILHYLDTSAPHKWARCPICFDSIYEKALKPVLFLPSLPNPQASGGSASADATSSRDDVREGEGEGEVLGLGSLRFRLMAKHPDTTLVLPRSASWPGLVNELESPFWFLPDVLTFSRFMLSTPAHLHASAKRDLLELAFELATLEALHDDLGAVYAKRAQEHIAEWEEHVDEMDLEDGGAREREKKERELEGWRGREKKRERERLRALEKERERASAPDLGAPLPGPEDFLASLSPGPGTPSPSPFPGTQQRGKPAPSAPSPTYYYYQAANGAAVFLHPLDIRILRSVYGSYERFPDEVVVGVEASEEGRVTPALRKTHKYLSHLPEGQDITFLEADLSTLCTPAQLAPFADLLHKRRERRREREEREERARRRAEREREAEMEREVALRQGGWGRNAGRGERQWEDWSDPQEGRDEPAAGSSPESESVNIEPPPAGAGAGAGAGGLSTSVPAAGTSPGVWGTRTFASAALANAAPRPRARPTSYPRSSGHGDRNRERERDEEEEAEREWEREREMDVAWLELESRALEERRATGGGGISGAGAGGAGAATGGAGGGGGGKGRKRKGQKLVILGGSGRGRA